ncbi:hypothetical protein [Actinoallomurus rhizosphaericola]|uniref:hypothetical protein n=1 Tax=Actinoallomurus rhizosphaericola TaxID=2952536 RepID=UPI0020905326|nr:hypothetical protein [Actinoallomurus rhizosphaericola]MCO5993299.1 hypothetical protein [Actinoallomurus rhizosphaericola]
MRKMYALGTGTMALAAVVGTGLAAHADKGVAPARPAAHKAATDGYQIVNLPNANVPGFQRRTVYCPAGKRAIGGGGEAQGNGAILVGSFPTPDGRGWIALGRQIGYSTVGISVYAICAY